MDTRKKKKSNSGQAIVEFVVAIIALLLIVTGGVFLFELNSAQRDMTTTLRAEAGHSALNGFSANSAQYIKGWENGKDERPGTADDQAVNGQAQLFNTLAGYGAADDPADWDRLHNLLAEAAPDRLPPSFYMLRQNPMPMSSLEFVRREDSRQVAVDRFLQQFLIPSESLTVTHEIYFPSCSDLY